MYESKKKPEYSTVLYAQCREEFRVSLEAQQLRVIMEIPQFDATIGAKCDAPDAERGRAGGKRGTQPHYTARQLERVFVYQWLCGLRSSKEARDRIAGDRDKEVRELLGFDRPCRSNPNIGPEVRMKAYEELLDLVVADPMQVEATKTLQIAKNSIVEIAPECPYASESPP